jgi:cytochrome c-type biogenesis protein CcmH/NrfF
MRLLICALLFAGLSCAPAGDTARAVEGQVWSPYCPGRLLVDCSTQQAAELRGEIARRVDRGDSGDEVLAWVRDEFGEAAVARPETSGFGLVIWLVPVLLFTIGGLVVWRFVSRNVEASEQENTHADP